MSPTAIDRTFSEDRFKAPPAYVCTIVSLLPYSITEEKPHLLPSVFTIPAADKEIGFSLFYMGEAIHYIPQPFDDKVIKQSTPPHEMGRSLCDDYNNAHICLSEDAMPGLFWVEGRLTSDDVKKYYGAELNEAERKQKNWFRNLVAMADADWQRNHNMMAVSDLQRIAARVLGIQKDWVDFQPMETITCPYCKAPISPDSVKCLNCHEIVNVVRYKEMQAQLGGTQ